MIHWKKFAALLLGLVALYSCALATASTQRVYDSARLFTDSEKRELEASIAQFQQDTGMDFVILTSSQGHEGHSSEEVADDFYDRYGFGLDEDKSGILYYIDMAERWHHLGTTGAMIDYMTDARIASAIDTCTPALSRDSYAKAANQMLDQVRSAIRSGIPEGQYQYDVLTGQRLTARHKALTTTELLVCGLAAGAVALLFIVTVRRRYQLKGSTYKYVYRDNSDMQLTENQDHFLRSATTRVRKPDPPSGGGGGGSFGGGGGSGVHVGSSGTSHGGGGGRF